MIEWKNQFNSFNSWKGAFYFPYYQAIKDWKDHKIKAPLAPIEASLDPIHGCNLQCDWCNASSYLNKNLKNKMMTNTHLINLITFLGKWGVKAVCCGGGGSPCLHPFLAEAIEHIAKCGMQSSVATNGTLFTDKLIAVFAKNCRWIGISIDSATSKTYTIGRKVNLFDIAIENMKQLVNKIRETNSSCEVAYKFLVFQHNQHEIYEACKLAKSIGVRDFHVRPADFSHQGMGNKKKNINPFNRESILQQFEECHKLENENFRVFTVLHKFSDSFIPLKNFSQCYASPCCIQLCADNNVYLCPDQRHQEFYRLGTHYPNPKEILNFWGNNRHYNLVFNRGKSHCNTRCTFAPYCKQCEELFIKNNDPMCKWFI